MVKSATVKPALPIIGDIVKYNKENISYITVASFLPDEDTINPSCFLLKKEHLGVYLDLASGFDINKSPNPIYTMSAVLKGCDHKFARLQPHYPNWEIIGKHDFGVSSEHIDAISKEGPCALACSFEIGEEKYVIEGNFIAKKDGKPSVMTMGGYGLPFCNKKTRLVLNIEHLLPSRGCDGNCQSSSITQQAIAASP